MAYYSKDSQGNPRKGRNLDELLDKIQSSKIENGTISIGGESITPITEQEADVKYSTKQELNTKQDIIPDLQQIRTNAQSGANAYHKPATGIPASDLASGVIPDTSNFVEESELSEVATSGDYNDLDNKPSLPSTFVTSVNNQTGAVTINEDDIIPDIDTIRDNATAGAGAAEDIEDIEELIPTQATPSNQLADKEFVNSSVATATATYRGSFNLVSDLSLTISATHAQVATALATAISTKDNNDYAFVQIPTADATPTEIASVDRYKYNGTSWEYEYTLNNSGYTAAQWEAINSAITSGLVTKLSALPTNAELTTLLNGKLSADALYAGAAVQGGAANKAVSIPFGQVDSTSTSTAFTATVDGITELRDGVCVYLRNGVVSSTSGCTLNINGLGAKPIYYSMAGSGGINAHFNIAYTMLFIYSSSKASGGCWDMFFGWYTDANTIGYDIREYTNGSKRTKTAVQRYQIMLSTFDGMLLPIYSGTYTTNTTKILTTDKFNPLGEVCYFGTTTNYNAGAVITSNILHSQATNTQIDLRYSFNCGSTLVAGDDVYLVCVPQSDGSAVLHSNPLAFALPTTEDGLLYKRLGKCYDTYRIILEQHKPVYYYKDGGIREWTGNTIPTELTDYSFTNKSVTQNGKMEIKQVGGDTVVWNQKAPESSMPLQNATRTYENGYTLAVLTNGESNVRMSGSFSHTGYHAGGKVLVMSHVPEYSVANAPFNNIRLHVLWNITKNKAANNAATDTTIVKGNTFYSLMTLASTVEATDTIGFYFDVNNNYSFVHTTDDHFKASYNIFDLTLMFGAGNEPSTAEEFEEWLNTHIGDSEYYSYNTGELLSVKAQGIQNGAETHNLDITTLTGKLNGEGSSVTIFPDGLKKAGTVADEIKVDNGVVKAVKRIGSVDLGTLNWDRGIKVNATNEYKFVSVVTIGSLGGVSESQNSIISKYSKGKTNNEGTNLVYEIGSKIGIVDNAYTTEASFKTAMSEVILYYELATPEEYILDNQSYLPLSYMEEKGSETILLPVNGDTPTHIAPRMNVRVSGEDEWVEDKIKALPKDYISSDSLESMLNAMKTAGIITSYTMTYNVNTGKYEFGFT